MALDPVNARAPSAEDEKFMRHAIALGEKAALVDCTGGPFGCDETRQLQACGNAGGAEPGLQELLGFFTRERVGGCDASSLGDDVDGALRVRFRAAHADGDLAGDFAGPCVGGGVGGACDEAGEYREKAERADDEEQRRFAGVLARQQRRGAAHG